MEGSDLGPIGRPEGQVELSVLGPLGRGEPEAEVVAVAEPDRRADVDRAQPERGEDGGVEGPARRHIGDLQRDVVDHRMHGTTFAALPRPRGVWMPCFGP